MSREFTLSDPGEGIHEAEIVDVQVASGDEVSDGDVLFVAETDKVDVDVPASFTGRVEEVLVSAGDQVEVGDTLLTYQPAGEEEAETTSEPEREEDPEDRSAGEEREAPEEEPKREQAEQGRQPEQEEEEEQETEEDADTKRQEGEEPPHDEDLPVPASPATRRLARELDVDLHEVEGSGEGGRVLDSDVEAFAEGEKKERKKKKKKEEEAPERRERPAARALTLRSPELPDFSRWGPVERVPLRSVRRATAQRMALAWSEAPHVMHEDIADITALERFRRDSAEEAEGRGGKLTLTTLVAKAVVAALKEFPRFNASLDPEAGEIVLKRYYHLGVAVATERGLIVPVLRDVDRKTVLELSRDLVELADAARDGDLELEQTRGGTFTITNPGPIGGTRFTPIINFPQVAILGMARASLGQVVSGSAEDSVVRSRLQLPLCLSFDHRVNDGADAARFVSFLCDVLADPESFALAV